MSGSEAKNILGFEGWEGGIMGRYLSVTARAGQAHSRLFPVGAVCSVTPPPSVPSSHSLRGTQPYLGRRCLPMRWRQPTHAVCVQFSAGSVVRGARLPDILNRNTVGPLGSGPDAAHLLLSLRCLLCPVSPPQDGWSRGREVEACPAEAGVWGSRLGEGVLWWPSNPPYGVLT